MLFVKLTFFSEVSLPNNDHLHKELFSRISFPQIPPDFLRQLSFLCKPADYSTWLLLHTCGVSLHSSYQVALVLELIQE